MLAQIFYGYVCPRLEPVLSENIVKDIFGGGCLTGGVDGLAAQILNRVDGVAVFENIENSAGVDSRAEDLAAGLVIQ